MIRNRLLSSILTGLMTINVVVAADSAPGRPKLVVGIVVDQLRSDYLEYLRDLFGDKGFRAFMDNGVFIKDLDLGADLNDPAATTALLYTGALPRANGVPSAQIYNSSAAMALPALEDKGSMGNYTHESLSPANLRVSTLSDEIAVDGGGHTTVYGISADAQQAIILAGHAGNCALWINDADGQWSSTAFYRDFPQFAARRNRTSPLRQRLDTIRWNPLLSLKLYPGLTLSQREVGFRYSFPTSDRDRISKFKASALANREVTDMAISAINELSMGSHANGIDMLNVGYTAAPYPFTKDGEDAKLELEDTYIRLDAQISRLLEAVDRRVGLQNSLIFISSTGYFNDPTPIDTKFRIPTGEVKLRRIESLLNSFLSAKFGNGDYIKGIHNNQIYLDHAALEKRGIDLSKVADEARSFIVKMSGIADARTLSDILASPAPDAQRQRNAIDPKSAGDLFLTFSPGWTITDDMQYPPTSTSRQSTAVATPFLMLAPGLKPQIITTPVDAAAIAPTISSTIHIRAPNGASSTPVQLK